jgi:hypothetical protein
LKSNDRGFLPPKPGGRIPAAGGITGSTRINLSKSGPMRLEAIL